MSQKGGTRPRKTLGRKRIGKVTFSVTARVAMQLGRESISSSITALIELVKNAYDADAAKVQIRFAALDSETPILIIEDDGIGMRKDDIRDFWMVIGTSNKTQLSRTSKGRIVTGEKGLGRLGLDRLCSRTRIQSKRKGSTAAVEVDIDWSQYENSNARLERIRHSLYSLPNLDTDPLTGRRKRFPHGTRLILEGLKDAWDEAAMTSLREELALLLSPFTRAKGFSIRFDSGMGWRSVDGLIPFPKMHLGAAEWKVLASLDGAGRASITMSSRMRRPVFRLPKTPWREFAKHGEAKPACGPLSFEFYFFPRKAVSLPEQTLGKKDIETLLNSNQGVRIYRDGFRVKPYGDPRGQGDWLGLSFRRIQSPAAVTRVGDWRVGYNQIIGAIFISRTKNFQLQDQTNREGLFQGEGFRDLRVFATKVVEFFEYHRSKFEDENTQRLKIDETRERARAAAKTSLEALNNLSKLVKGTAVSKLDTRQARTEWLADIKTALNRVKREIALDREAVEDSEQASQLELERTLEEKNTMANLASLGILAASFGHETLGLSGVAQKNARWLHSHITKDAILLPHRLKEEVELVLDDLLETSAQIHSFAKFTLDSVSPTKRRKKIFSLATIVLDVFKAFKESLVVQRNTSVKLRLPEVKDEVEITADSSGWESALKGTETLAALTIRAYPSDWESILVNLITNAIWAMEGTRSKSERHIRVELQSGPNECVLVFEDSGRGLESGTEEQIFTPTFSTKRDRAGNIYGTGMGLAIVKSCVEENSDGSIRALARGKLGGATFIIRVPRATE